MSRLLALAASALLGLALPATAAPVVFTASAAGSSIDLTCGPSAGECTRLEADLLFNDGNRRVSGPVNPDLNFGMILFDGDEADDEYEDKKKKGKSGKKSSKDSLFSDTFGITATLAFFITDPGQLFTVIAKGDGSYSVKEDDLKSLTLAWQPIEDLFVPGIGTFAFSFSNLGAINVPTLFARSANSNDDDEDEGENDGGISLRVAATVTQVSVVPLPAGSLLLLSAFGLLAISARQRRRALAA
jgi:hypothetical protein